MWLSDAIGGVLARVGEKRNAWRILVQNSEGTISVKVLSLDERIILKWGIGEIGWKGVDWINNAWDRKKWRAVVKTLREFRFA